jgi:hypothetical protein
MNEKLKNNLNWILENAVELCIVSAIVLLIYAFLWCS